MPNPTPNPATAPKEDEKKPPVPTPPAPETVRTAELRPQDHAAVPHAPAKVDKGPRYRIVHPTGGFQRGDVATLAQLVPLDPKLDPEERAEATKAGIDRLIGLGAVAPAPADED